MLPGAPRDEQFRLLLRAAAFQSLRNSLRWALTLAAKRSLRAVLAALQKHALDTAIRLIDRAWRSQPDAAAVLAPVYGKLLVLEDRDPVAALRLLQRVNEPDPDVAALIIRALLQLGRREDAGRALQQALANFRVMPGGLLAHVAGPIPGHLDSIRTNLAAQFGLDGRAGGRGRLVSGWVRLGWQPDRPPRLCVETKPERAS